VVGFTLSCLALFGSQTLRSILPPGTSLSTVTDLFSNRPSPVVPNEFQVVTLGKEKYRLEVVKTFESRAQGLSDRNALAPATGMRFIFDIPGNYSFWMHNMRFPLDMVFIDSGKIVQIANNVPFPKTATEEPVTIHPQQVYTDVLELKAGEADRLGLKIGQTIQLPK
jgi:uncharacterized membrane protein (UPF0127 family)